MLNQAVDRSIAPKIEIPETVSITKAEEYRLSSGKKLHIFSQGLPDLIRFEMVFDAGVVKDKNPVLPGITNAMLDEGTVSYSARETAELIDYYAANLNLNVGKHTAVLSIHTLKKHFPKLLDLLMEMVTRPNFPENEFQIVKQSRYQNFLIKRENTEFLASEKFWKVIFGDTHPYGISALPEHFTQISRKQLQSFHTNHYHGGKALFLLSGRPDDSLLSLLDDHLKEFSPSKERGFLTTHIPPQPAADKYHLVHKPGAMQASIRMGMPTINKMHADYIPLSIANVLLGGYFGSRLMTNIREDKGYTYGIYSSLASLFGAGYFLISAETNQESVNQSVIEIKRELHRLRTEPVAMDELKTVRHYLLGSLLENFDGPDATAGAFKSVYFYGLDETWFLKYINTLKTISPTDIMAVADKYLREEQMYTVVSGDKSLIQ